MYLISVYFDEETNRILNRYIKKIADKSGNQFMLENRVPPHLTIAALETRNPENLLCYVKNIQKNVKSGNIKFVSVGALFPYVLYITPVMDSYLFHLSQLVNQTVKEMSDVKINRFYQPFQWLPHITVGKTLEKEQMMEAFKVMQNNFIPFEGRIVKIGLARTNPHEDIFIGSMH